MFFSLFLSLVSLTSAGSYSSNLVKNPSFEQLTIGGWRYFGEQGYNKWRAINNRDGIGNTIACAFNGWNTQAGTASQRIRGLTPGKRVVVSFFHRVNNWGTPSSISLSVGVKTTTGEPVATAILGASSLSAEWTRSTLNFVLPANVAEVDLNVIGWDNAGTLYVDNVRFQYEDDFLLPGIVGNKAADSGFDDEPWISPFDDGSAIESGGHTGWNSYVFRAISPRSVVHNMYNTWYSTGNYRLSFWGKIDAVPSSDCTIRVQWGNSFFRFTCLPFTSGFHGQFTTEWQFFSFPVTPYMAGPNSVPRVPYLQQLGLQGNAPNAVAIRFDDVTFEELLDASGIPVHRKRALAMRQQMLLAAHPDCPVTETACPVFGSDGSMGKGFECIDPQNEVGSCGGCLHLGGVDCESADGVARAGCQEGLCVTFSCKPGFKLDQRHNLCIQN